MISFDLLPYFFSTEPSPVHDSSAFAIARPVPKGVEAGISIVLEEADRCTEIFKFSRLGLVKIAWSHCGQLLAFAHDSTLMVRASNGELRLGSLNANVQWLGFDRDQQLWCVNGNRLEMFERGGMQTISESVESVAASTHLSYCRREDEGLRIYSVGKSSGKHSFFLPDMPADSRARLFSSGDYLLAVLQSAVVNRRSRVRIVRLNISTCETHTLLDEELAFGFNGGPSINAAVLETGDVFAAFETGDHTRVCALAPGMDGPEPISPEGFEVFDFALNGTGTRVAIIASDINTPDGACERQLLIGRRVDGGGWQFSKPSRGVYEAPRWRFNSGLEILQGSSGRWERTILDADQDFIEGASSPFSCHSGPDYDFFDLPGPRHLNSAVILLPRFHQQFVAGGQSFFFNHLLFSVARGLADIGHCVVVLNGPGSVGRGRLRRELDGSYFCELRGAVSDLIQVLRTRGLQSFGILGGSMAAVPALRFACRGTSIAACAFVSPLFEASIPITEPWARFLRDDPNIESFEATAARAEAGLLVVRGAQDEVVPEGQILRLRNGIVRQDLIELCLLQEEGHVFRRAASWYRTQDVIQNFFASRLNQGELPASGEMRIESSCTNTMRYQIRSN